MEYVTLLLLIAIFVLIGLSVRAPRCGHCQRRKYRYDIQQGLYHCLKCDTRYDEDWQEFNDPAEHFITRLEYESDGNTIFPCIWDEAEVWTDELSV